MLLHEEDEEHFLNKLKFGKTIILDLAITYPIKLMKSYLIKKKLIQNRIRISNSGQRKEPNR